MWWILARSKNKKKKKYKRLLFLIFIIFTILLIGQYYKNGLWQLLLKILEDISFEIPAGVVLVKLQIY